MTAGHPADADPAPDTREHTSEVLASHPGQPGISEQSATHGAPLPAADHGAASDKAKYAP
jgi:hypothetical protein